MGYRRLNDKLRHDEDIQVLVQEMADSNNPIYCSREFYLWKHLNEKWVTDVTELSMEIFRPVYLIFTYVDFRFS